MSRIGLESLSLLSQPETFDQLTITGKVMLLKIIQQAFPFTDQLHESAVSGEIFFVGLQVSADLADSFCE